MSRLRLRVVAGGRRQQERSYIISRIRDEEIISNGAIDGVRGGAMRDGATRRFGFCDVELVERARPDFHGLDLSVLAPFGRRVVEVEPGTGFEPVHGERGVGRLSRGVSILVEGRPSPSPPTVGSDSSGPKPSESSAPGGADSPSSVTSALLSSHRRSNHRFDLLNQTRASRQKIARGLRGDPVPTGARDPDRLGP